MSLVMSCEELYGTKDLYKILEVDKYATGSEIKKAYYKLSLQVHPDKVQDDYREKATHKFQVLGKIYSILSDTEKRAVYDESGEIDEDNFTCEDKDWYQYWRLLFKKISVHDIVNFEKKYKGSNEELDDLKKAYLDGEGDMDYILANVLCATVEDENRYENIISKWISKNEVPVFSKFSTKNKKQKETRKRKASKEALEAEDMKKALGLQDCEKSLENIIMERNSERGRHMDSFLDSLAAKYGAKRSKGKKK